MPSFEFVFEKNSLLNTTIRLSTEDSTVYEIHTRLPGSSTHLFRLDPDTESRSKNRTLMASINRKMFLPNTVSFPGVPDQSKREERISKWLKKGTLNNSPASILHLNGSESPTFLADHEEYNLALFSQDKKTILAHWQPPTPSAPRALTLVISASVDSKNYIEILLAFIFQTEKLRTRTTPMDVVTAGTGLMAGPGVGPH